MLIFVKIITIAVSLITTKLLAVNFSLSDFGTYSQVNLIIGFVVSFSILGLTDAANFYFNRFTDINCQKKYICTVFGIQVIIGFVFALLIIVFRKDIASLLNNGKLVDLLLMVALAPLLTNLINMYQVLFISIGQAKTIAVRNFLISITKLCSVIIACYCYNDIVPILIVTVLADIIQVIYFSYFFKNKCFFIDIRQFDRKLVIQILGFCVPMAVYVLTNSLTRDCDKLVINYFSDVETLAIYSNASKLLPFDIITASIITVLVPIITRFITRKDFYDARILFRLYLRLGYLTTCILVGGAIFLSKYLMLILYDVKYLEGLTIFNIYLIVDMVRFANITTILTAANKTRLLMKLSGIILLINIILSIVFYYFFGINGPAFATLLLTLLLTIVLLYLGTKELECSVIDILDFRELLTLGFQIMIVGGIASFISNWLYYVIRYNVYITMFMTYSCYLVVLLFLNKRKFISCVKQLEQYR